MGNNKTHLVIHHSATKDGTVPDWPAIRRYHKDVNGWSNIGYHAGLEMVGNGVEVFLGRMPDKVGAHCRELHMNSRGIGICVVGNFDLGQPPELLWRALIELCAFFMRTYNISYNNVIGHREAQVMDPQVRRALKTCPGLQFNMDALRRELMDPLSL